MRKRSLFLVMVLVWVMVAACATFQAKWDAATPIEKSRITISQFQGTLQAALNAGGLYVDKNPQYRQVWKDKGLTTATYINKLLDQFIIDLDAGKPISFTTITSAVATKMAELVALIQSWGVKI
jgi:hypothetical protein